MDKQQKIKKISLLRSSVRPAKRALIATTKRRIKHLLTKKEESKDHIIQTKFEKEIKSARGTIGCLKALQTTDIIKFGLRTDLEQLQAILQRGQADVNTRAMARLCSKKIIQNAFQEFKVNNPDWKKMPISEFKVGKGVQKPKQTDQNKKKNKGKKALKPRKNSDEELSEGNEAKVEKSPKKKAIVKEEVASSPVKKNRSKVQSPKKAPSPKKPAENLDESRDSIKSEPSKIKVKSSNSPAKLTPSPAKKLNKRKKVSDVLSNVSSTRESTGLSDKTPKRVKFDDELTKTQKTKSLPESTPKSDLKPIIKKTPSETKQKIQKPTRGKNLSEQRKRNKLRM